MDFLSIIVVVLLVAVLLKQISYITKLQIKTKKNTVEKFAIIASAVVLFWLTHIFAENNLHYVAGFIAILFIIANWIKQGISYEGILLVAKGKELYRWNEIGEVKVTMGDLVTIEYFNGKNLLIVSQSYKIDDYEKIKNILQDKGIKTELVNKA